MNYPLSKSYSKSIKIMYDFILLLSFFSADSSVSMFPWFAEISYCSLLGRPFTYFFRTLWKSFCSLTSIVFQIVCMKVIRQNSNGLLYSNSNATYLAASCRRMRVAFSRRLPDQSKLYVARCGTIKKNCQKRLYKRRSLSTKYSS